MTASTVAAFLTIIGYSIYDTIIIFDRVRENLPIMRRSSIKEIVNTSLWETVRRSVATTIIVLLPVSALLLFGGETLRDFAFAILIGISISAFSTIFIAAPFLAVLLEHDPQYASRRGPRSGRRRARRREARAPCSAGAREPLRQRWATATVSRRRPRPPPRRPPPVRCPSRPRPRRPSASAGASAGVRGRMAAPANPLSAVIERMAAELASAGNLSLDDARRLVEQLADRWRGEAARAGERAGAALDGFFGELGLVTRDDFVELELRVAQLEHRLRLVEGGAGPGDGAAAPEPPSLLSH